MDVLADGMPVLTSGQIALLISGGAILFVILHWRRNAMAKRGGTSPTASPVMANPLSVREVTSEVQALLGDLEETSRRLTAQLDNRYTRLEQLLAEADDRIRKLESLTHAAPSTTLPPPPASVIADARQTLARLRQERGAPAPTDDPAYQPVYSLADRGKSSREIAQELGRQPGEIELILALRPRA